MLLMSCTREDKAQRTNPPYRPYSRSRLIGSCPIDSHRNPAKVILERTGFPAYNISSRVAWKFRGGENCKTFRECGVAMNAKQRRIKRVYSALMQNEHSFCKL